MLAAVLTAFGFSLSVIFAARSARVLGGQTANLARLIVAMVLLALWAHGFGSGLGGGALGWFIWSGIIGFGLGDVALFASIERIGPRLTILLTQCLAAPIGALAEWLWLGTVLTWQEALWSGLILVGVAFALAPDEGWMGDRRTFWIGTIFGIGAATGQALGAVVSRKAYQVAAAATGMVPDGGTAAYQRILGGVLVSALAFALIKRMRKTPVDLDATRWRRAAPLVLANALAGPALGVACYQWALRSTEIGIVLAVVATAPLMTMMLAWPIDGTRPTRRAVVGSFIAVAGVAGLKYFSTPG